MLIGMSSNGRNLDDQRVSVTRLDITTWPFTVSWLPTMQTRSLAAYRFWSLGDNDDNDVVIESATAYLNHHIDIDINYHEDDAAFDDLPSSF